MNSPVIYFRGSLAEEEEKRAAAKYFPIVERRTAIPAGSLVIPRYSALPYNKELEEDMTALGSTLINTHVEHVFIADLKNWYAHLEEVTPKTWFALDEIPDQGPFFLKGETNSKKFQYYTHAFANNKKEAVQVYLRLKEDGYVGHQSIYIRKYVPLRKLMDSIGGGPPVSEEYRFFVLDGEVLAGGFYWESYIDDIEQEVSTDFVPVGFLESAIDQVKDYIRFFVIDVARTAEGNWIVIELNDGQMSGLSAVDPDVLYKNLWSALKK